MRIKDAIKLEYSIGRSILSLPVISSALTRYLTQEVHLGEI